MNVDNWIGTNGNRHWAETEKFEESTADDMKTGKFEKQLNSGEKAGAEKEEEKRKRHGRK